MSASAVEFSLYLMGGSLIDKVDDRFKKILRWSDADVIQRPLTFLFPKDARGRVDRFFSDEHNLEDEIVIPRVPLRVKTGGYVNFDMKMHELAGGSRRLDFYKHNLDGTTSLQQSRPYDIKRFFDFVEDMLKASRPTRTDYTMVTVEGLSSDVRLNEEERQAARSEVEKKLRGKSVGGQIGKIGETSYGLVTRGGFDTYEFEREMSDVARKLNLPLMRFGAKAESIAIDDPGISSGDLWTALRQSTEAFLGKVDSAPSHKSISSVIGGVKHTVKLINQAIEKSKYRMSFRRVADVYHDSAISFLVEGKLALDGRICHPGELLVLEDHPALAVSYDLGQIGRLLASKAQLEGKNRNCPYFYEVSHASLLQGAFLRGLKDLLKQYGHAAGHVGFRVRGLGSLDKDREIWTAVNILSAEGHPVWIDRFGEAVATPEILECLYGGHVELPLSLLKTLDSHAEGQELMAKLVKAWKLLDVTIVAIDLVGSRFRKMALDLGVTALVDDAEVPSRWSVN